MSTGGMIPYSRNDFLALAENSDVAMAIRENMADGDSFSMADLVRVKTPSSGGLYWTIPTVSGDEISPTLEGILVFQARQGILWPTLESNKDSKPVMVTNDMKYGRLVCAEEEVPAEMLETIRKYELPDRPGYYDWQSLPYCQFGTGKNGIGKFAKETRPLFLLRKGDPWPLVVRVGPGSLKAVSQFIMRLNVPYYRAVVSLALKQETSQGGQDYSSIVPTLKGVLSAEEGEVVKQLYTSTLKAGWEAGKLNDHIDAE